MSTSQRVSRGFHRRALVWAAIPLLVGGYFSVVYAVGEASMPPAEVWSRPALKIEGFGTVPMPPGFDRLTRDEQDELVDQMATSLRPQWRANFSEALGVSLASTLAVSLAVYGVVRAIGWVVGGFAAS
jgi:hypothetical protein